METRPLQYLSLRTRLAITLIILATLFSVVVSSALYVNFRREMRQDLRHRLQNIASLAGLQQDGDTFEKVQAQNDEWFQKIHATNLRIKKSEPDLRFVYTMRKQGNNIIFIVDAGVPGEADISAYGDVYKEPSQTLVGNFDSMTATVVEPDIYSDEFGSFLSAYTPIFNSTGQRVGILGVDITANTVLAQEKAYLVQLIWIFLATLPFIVLAGFLAANYLAEPIIDLRNAANRMSEGEYDFKIEHIPHTRELAEMAADFNIMSGRLSGLIDNLEGRVVERTESLIRKSDQLRAASRIARQTAEVQELSALLDLAVNLVTDQFGFYHTGVFLMNESGEEAILHAASSEGGQQMIQREYSLSVGQQGIVGYVAAHKKPRIVLDVGNDAVFFNNPDLPMTRSEVALPLLIRDKLLGILDIQSDRPQAFSVDDIDVLQTLADQLAVAIENARLLDESQAALSQLEALTGAQTREAWKQKLNGKSRAFTYTPLGLRAETLPAGENAVSVPLTLRGEQIGKISIARKAEATITEAEENMIAEVATQAGLAIDNIRLLEEATQRARQEQTVGRLAARFSQSLDINTLLQTAARELAALPDVSQASVLAGDKAERLQVAAVTKHGAKLPQAIQAGIRGYRSDSIRHEALTELSELERTAYEGGVTLNSGTDGQVIFAVPVKLREQSIGVISIKLKENHGDETIAIVQLASERLAAALESARLYEEARLRADREQSIAQVTAAISSSTNYEEILQTTVREIGGVLRDTEVTIQIVGDLQDGKSAG